MSKYDPLGEWLTNAPAHTRETTLSLRQIEILLGFRLPNSAKRHRAWWANPSSAEDHPYARSWLATGWKVDTVNLSEEWVRFRCSASG
jgi:hypothetical protein